eukprot:11258103-Ditylum_brightwellii.AAC.1
MLEEPELLIAFKKFTRDIGGQVPQRMITDRNFKIIGGKVAEFLQGIQLDPAPDEENTGQAFVLGAPAGRQNQNGPAEIKWRYVMVM